MRSTRRKPKFRRSLGGAALAAVMGLTSVAAMGSPASAAPTGKADSPACSSSSVDLDSGTSRAPQNLCVPAQATDSNKTLLVWNKPDIYDDVVDYRVYMDGRAVGTAEENARIFSPAQEYVDAFRDADKDDFHVRTVAHNYTVTGLSPRTSYQFTVTAIRADGSESPASAPITVSTTPERHQVTITSPAFKAVGDGKALNTASIQKAIDTCRTPGCTVVVPAGTFKTGALFLHSDMTLELQEGARLLGSDHAEDYPLDKGYYLYPVPDPLPTEAEYRNYRRPPSLINVLPEDNGRSAQGREPGAAANNVRIVGKGVVDGNGWERTAEGSVMDEAGNEIPQYVASSAGKVLDDGVLAADQFRKAKENPKALTGIINRPETLDDSVLYGQYRSSLMTFMGVKNLYVEGVTADNPAFHGVMILDTENSTVNGMRHTTYNANNGDGLEFGGATNGIVLNNFFDTGDDQVNFAAGQGKYGAMGRPSENVWIFNNYMRMGHGGVAVGSNTAAWVQRVLAEDNVMYKVETGGLRMKSTSDMAGGGRDFLFRDTAMACMGSSAFIMTLSYNQSPSGYIAAESATFKDVKVRNVSVDGNNSPTCGMAVSDSKPVIDIQAGPSLGEGTATLSAFTFQDVVFRNVNPTNIKGLTNSTFDDVTFQSVRNNANPWRLDQYSTGNTFTDVTPAPAQ
ncbi:glycosyl hydrolase family 28 protein [Paenarthrobacter nitroguajacolicus]|uniref:glycosyl hydrolase family 28 protein n=1 Tax=Paenarthrobacter nitroguajacolicus TaxID=211146 RepID=UPI00248AB214|nr:glycoside hydrolase family 28 protein [Paenarthrobacter nitroguajacolicus]MDI2035542.1 Exo-poly-alpha-D-galacturonosidase [Paenarthrobacter nitroguajacolicus]